MMPRDLYASQRCLVAWAKAEHGSVIGLSTATIVTIKTYQIQLSWGHAGRSLEISATEIRASIDAYAYKHLRLCLLTDLNEIIEFVGTKKRYFLQRVDALAAIVAALEDTK